MRRHTTTAAVAATVLAAGVLAGCLPYAREGQPVTPPSANAETVTVARVVDGDTLLVTPSGRAPLRVRLIGVDTPEVVKPDTPPACFGPEASTRTHTLADRATVRLELDPAVGRVDRYGRTLAYVWLPNDQLLNEQLIIEGYGREYDYHHQHYRYRDPFRAAQTSAQHAGRGLWGKCPA